MTKLLVSVRSAEEAELALHAGADLIDVKEPSRGALGAADESVWQQVREVVGQRRPISVALGELLDLDTSVFQSLAGISYAKMGLAGCYSAVGWIDTWQNAVRLLPGHVTAVAVAYADWQQADAPAATSVLSMAVQAGCRGILLDTFEKSAGSLLSRMPIDELSRWVAAARAVGLTVVLAGSITEHSIPQVLSCSPDYIGIRGAVCRAGREGELDPALVRQLGRLTRGEQTAALSTPANGIA